MAGEPDLRSYRDLVYSAMARAVRTGEPEYFENGGPAHAKIVVDAMMEAATTSLNIIAGTMRDDVWSLSNVHSFLARSPEARLRVILDDKRLSFSEDVSVAAKVLGHPQAEVRYLSEPFGLHLCIADGAHVRLEHDKLTREASIMFGDPQCLGRKALEVFEQLWGDSLSESAFIASFQEAS